MEIDQSFQDGDQSSFHFLEEDGIVIKVSQAIFEDFHSLVTTNLPFSELVRNLYDICNNGVESIRKLSTGIRKGNPMSQDILTQLCEERNAYLLIWSLFEAESSAKNTRQAAVGSLLQNLLVGDVEFRKLHLIVAFGTQLCSWNRNQDLELVLSQGSALKPQYEESITHLFQLILAYVRCGRTEDAIDLANQSGCFTLAGLIDTRNALFETELTPTDINDDNFGFSDSRASFKYVARKTISKTLDTSRLTQLQQCIWAALSGALPPLLSYANCTDDRLWAYLNCAVEARFDEYAAKDSDRKYYNDDDLPRSAAEIFEELFRSETGEIYKIYGYLSTADFAKIGDVLSKQLSRPDKMPPAHVARFHAHLVLLLKFMGKELNAETSDKVICQFVDVLISLDQFVLAPYYLSQVSSEVTRKKKLIHLLRSIRNENVRKEVLVRLSECGIDSNEICLAVYREVKDESVLTGDESKITKTISELLRAWRWLTYNGSDTIYDALVEANFIIRSLFVMSRMAEIVELIQLAGNDLTLEVEKAFAEESGGSMRKPFELEKAQREYQGYVEYFEATGAYNTWLAHVEKPIPQLPSKLTDENWARLDLKRRAEYDLFLQEARESRQRYEQISISLRTNAVTLLENILKESETWLIAVGGQAATEEEEQSRNIEKLREDYLSGVITALINVHRKSGEQEKVLKVSRLIVDTKYNVHQYLSRDKLRKILKLIAKSGAVIVETN